MVNGVAQPVLVSTGDERERLQRVFRKMLRFTAFISFPALWGLALIVPELIPLAITDKWLPCVPILQMLCIGGAFIPIITLYTNLIISRGRSDIYMFGTIAIGLIQMLVMWLLHPYGMQRMVLVAGVALFCLARNRPYPLCRLEGFVALCRYHGRGVAGYPLCHRLHRQPHFADDW